jgi:hypothetical protein
MVIFQVFKIYDPIRLKPFRFCPRKKHASKSNEIRYVPYDMIHMYHMNNMYHMIHMYHTANASGF